MTFQVTIKEVTVETVAKGKTKYQIANVAYEYQGEARTQKVMSFSNPDVFKKLQEVSPGDVLEITVTKNDKGYNQWSKVEVSTGEAKVAAPVTGKVLGSNYETPQERADNRVRIVRQSCLNYAVSTLNSHGPVNSKAAMDLAQEYFDWVYQDATV